MSKKKRRKANSKSRSNVVGAGSNSTKANARKCAPGSPNLVARAWLTVVALVLVQGGVWAARSFLMQSSTRELNRPLSELPYQLGEFAGEDRRQDSRLFEALEAMSSISRIYTRGDGRVVSLHLAAWDDEGGFVPHTPDICYPTSGWSEQNRKRVELSTEPRVQSALRAFAADGREVKVLFWYRLGEVTYTDVSEARVARRHLIGAREWPPVVKVMLQTDAIGESELLLREFAPLVDEWTREL